jgi:hypothetical protein
MKRRFPNYFVVEIRKRRGRKAKTGGDNLNVPAFERSRARQVPAARS